MKNEWKEFEFDVPMNNGLYLICYTDDNDEYQFVELAYWLNQGTVVDDLGYGDEIVSELQLTSRVKLCNAMGLYDRRVITKTGFYEFNLKKGLDFIYLENCPGKSDLYYIKLDKSKVPFDKSLFEANKY